MCGLAFGDEREEDAMMDDMRARWPRAIYRENKNRADKIARQIFETVDGDLPLHLIGTPWQIKVWQALLEIPVRQGHDLPHHRGESSQRKGEPRSRHCCRTQSGLLADPVPPRAGQRWYAAWLPLGPHAQAINAGAGSGASGQSQNVRHRIESGLLALSPFRGGKRTGREDAAVFRTV